MTQNLFQSWLDRDPPQHDRVRVYKERDGTRESSLVVLRELVIDHFVGLAIVARAGGLSRAAAIIQSSLPSDKRTRSGDLGELLATEYVDAETPYRVPVRKLRWKDEREMAMRGNDVIAVDTSGREPRVLKVESKSRAMLTAGVLGEATDGLDKHDGRPNPSTLAFIVKRLYEQNRDGEASLYNGFLAEGSLRARQITHLVFTVSGNDPTTLLAACPTPEKAGIGSERAGVLVPDHQDFIDQVFGGTYGTEP